VSDFLEEKRQEIADRLKELGPVVDEFNRLEAAATALADAIGSAASEASASTVAVATVTRRRKKGPGRPRGSSTGKKGPGRPRGSGKRARKATRAGTPAASTPAATVAVTADATPATAERKGPGRPKGSGKKVGRPKGSGKKAGRPKGKAGRPKGGGKRAMQALSLVQAQPGITIPELAAKMGIKQNYLYRVLPGLEQEGKLEKKGRGWHPTA
jgi:hypothetical protein